LKFYKGSFAWIQKPKGIKLLSSISKDVYKSNDDHVRGLAKNSGVPHNAGFLAVLFFVSFFWTSKRKKLET